MWTHDCQQVVWKRYYSYVPATHMYRLLTYTCAALKYLTHITSTLKTHGEAFPDEFRT